MSQNSTAQKREAPSKIEDLESMAMFDEENGDLQNIAKRLKYNWSKDASRTSFLCHCHLLDS